MLQSMVLHNAFSLHTFDLRKRNDPITRCLSWRCVIQRLACDWPADRPKIGFFVLIGLFGRRGGCPALRSSVCFCLCVSII